MSFTFRDMTRLDKMIATSVIRTIYIIGIVLGIIAGIIAVIAAVISMGNGFFTGLVGLIVAIIGTVIGLLFWRVTCELWIVTFGIYDRLGEIKANTARQG